MYISRPTQINSASYPKWDSTAITSHPLRLQTKGASWVQVLSGLWITLLRFITYMTGSLHGSYTVCRKKNVHNLACYCTDIHSWTFTIYVHVLNTDCKYSFSCMSTLPYILRTQWHCDITLTTASFFKYFPRPRHVMSRTFIDQDDLPVLSTALKFDREKIKDFQELPGGTGTLDDTYCLLQRHQNPTARRREMKWKASFHHSPPAWLQSVNHQHTTSASVKKMPTSK